MEDIDSQLEQIRALLDHGYVARAHALATKIVADAPQHSHAQALLAEATDRLNRVPTARVPHDPAISVPIPQRRRLGVVLAILATLIVFGGLARSVLSNSRPATGLSPSPVPPSFPVMYRVTVEDNGLVDLSYSASLGGQIETQATGRWNHTQEVYPGSAIRLEVRVSRATTVTCSITSGITIIAQASFSGGAGSAVCEGIAN